MSIATLPTPHGVAPCILPFGVGAHWDWCASHRKDGYRAAALGRAKLRRGRVEELMITRLTIKELTVERVR